LPAFARSDPLRAVAPAPRVPVPRGGSPHAIPIPHHAISRHAGVWSSAFYLGLIIKVDEGVPSRTIDLNFAAKEFTDMLFEWSQYKEASMTVQLTHVRRADLPEHVRPKRARTKRKRSPGADGPEAKEARTTVLARAGAGAAADGALQAKGGGGPERSGRTGLLSAHADLEPATVEALPPLTVHLAEDDL